MAGLRGRRRRPGRATLIPESALLQLPVFTMLRRNVDSSVIVALVAPARRGGIAAAAKARVYLARRNPEAAFRATGERRGLAWLFAPRGEQRRLYVHPGARRLSGLDGLLRLLARAHADLCGAIVDRLDVPKLVLDVRHGRLARAAPPNLRFRRRPVRARDVPRKQPSWPG